MTNKAWYNINSVLGTFEQMEKDLETYYNACHFSVNDIDLDERCIAIRDKKCVEVAPLFSYMVNNQYPCNDILSMIEALTYSDCTDDPTKDIIEVYKLYNKYTRLFYDATRKNIELWRFAVDTDLCWKVFYRNDLRGIKNLYRIASFDIFYPTIFKIFRGIGNKDALSKILKVNDELSESLVTALTTIYYPDLDRWVLSDKKRYFPDLMRDGGTKLVWNVLKLTGFEQTPNSQKQSSIRVIANDPSTLILMTRDVKSFMTSTPQTLDMPDWVYFDTDGKFEARSYKEDDIQREYEVVQFLLESNPDRIVFIHPLYYYNFDFWRYALGQ